MIPINIIKQWRQAAPWIYQSQVEQDLVLSRALVALYQSDVIQQTLAFRGGTALNKLFVDSPARYSEDLDFVQINNEPIGNTLTAIRRALDPWLGKARWKQTERSAKLIYRFQSEDNPSVPLRLKIEINTIESFTVFGYEMKNFSIDTRWFTGSAQIRTYCLNELMGTKLRALYQRSKGRDLYDLWLGITKLGMNCQKVIEVFRQYNDLHNFSISRAEFEKNLMLKMRVNDFLSDLPTLLSGASQWDVDTAFDCVMQKLISRLPGEPWKGEDLQR